ncbi:MAG: hypothetical protein ACI4HO_08615 [Ruminococcus sp.]
MAKGRPLKGSSPRKAITIYAAEDTLEKIDAIRAAEEEATGKTVSRSDFYERIALRAVTPTETAEGGEDIARAARESLLNIIRLITARQEPPEREGDIYNERAPWPKFGGVSSGIVQGWFWYGETTILQRATMEDVLLALKEISIAERKARERNKNVTKKAAEQRKEK